MKKIISAILVMATMCSLMVPAFAVEYREENEIGTETDIEMAKEAYAALSPEAKAIFDAALADDQELLQFHKWKCQEMCSRETPKI